LVSVSSRPANARRPRRKSRKGGKDEGRKQKTNVAAKSRVPARLNDIVSMLLHLLNSSERRKEGQKTHEFSNQVPPTVKFFSYRLKSMRSPRCWSRRMAAMIPEKPAPTGGVGGEQWQEKKRDEGRENEEEGEGKKEVSIEARVRKRKDANTLMATFSFFPLCPAGWSSSLNAPSVSAVLFKAFGRPVWGSRSMLIILAWLQESGEVRDGEVSGGGGGR
jgi:hypothetical protein